MRDDTDGVGGFFEDLPVLAFVLAGVLSVAGAAAWTESQLSDADANGAVREAASRLLEAIERALEGESGIPSLCDVRSANVSLLADSLPDGMGYAISIWCVHPFAEALVIASSGWVEPLESCSTRSFMNTLCEGGIVGVLEVCVVAWQTAR